MATGCGRSSESRAVLRTIQSFDRSRSIRRCRIERRSVRVAWRSSCAATRTAGIGTHTAALDDAIDPVAVDFLRAQIKTELLAYHAGKKASDRVLLPMGRAVRGVDRAINIRKLLSWKRDLGWTRFRAWSSGRRFTQEMEPSCPKTRSCKLRDAVRQVGGAPGRAKARHLATKSSI
jgi:hypothetical protein